MTDKITISAFQLFEMFPDEDSARAYLEGKRWPAGVCCPTCGVVEKIVKRGGKRAGYYRCPEGKGEEMIPSGVKALIPIAMGEEPLTAEEWAARQRRK